ncbi:MAG TPA: HD domain-containing protein [Spirochaetota bacterium]|nr:HD domain-containing protein [Spirochaetota bacterium]
MDRQRAENARRLMRLLDRDPLHAEQVRFLAVRLFDDLKKLHGLGASARDCLEAAALLHDTGYSRGLTRHHKRSAEIIMEKGIDGFDRKELRVIALTARYHRKSGPKRSHAEFAALPRADRALVEKLGALLRIADGLDRSHDAAVRDLEAAAGPSSVTLFVTAGSSIGAEISAMEKKSDLFETVFRRKIRVETRSAP